MERVYGYARIPGTGAPTTATVAVYEKGTLIPATIYADNLDTPTPKANPFTAQDDGYFFFYTENGRIDITFSGDDIEDPYTWGDILVTDAGDFGWVDVEFGDHFGLQQMGDDHDWNVDEEEITVDEYLNINNTIDLNFGAMETELFADGVGAVYVRYDLPDGMIIASEGLGTGWAQIEGGGWFPVRVVAPEGEPEIRIYKDDESDWESTSDFDLFFTIRFQIE